MTIPHLRPRTGLLALAVASGLAVALTTPAVHAAPSAHAARATSCDISNVSRRLGPTYVTSLKVSRVSCDGGISVVKAFHQCRLAHGPSGRCVRTVKDYACRETRTNSIPTQFTANVTCTKGRKSVVHAYTQYT